MAFNIKISENLICARPWLVVFAAFFWGFPYISHAQEMECKQLKSIVDGIQNICECEKVVTDGVACFQNADTLINSEMDKLIKDYNNLVGFSELMQEAQEAWSVYRSKQCELQAYMDHQQDHIARNVTQLNCEVTMAWERYVDLQHKIDGLK